MKKQVNLLVLMNTEVQVQLLLLRVLMLPCHQTLSRGKGLPALLILLDVLLGRNVLMGFRAHVSTVNES